jgi:hypothetical protein
MTKNPGSVSSHRSTEPVVFCQRRARKYVHCTCRPGLRPWCCPAQSEQPDDAAILVSLFFQRYKKFLHLCTRSGERNPRIFRRKCAKTATVQFTEAWPSLGTCLADFPVKASLRNSQGIKVTLQSVFQTCICCFCIVGVIFLHVRQSFYRWQEALKRESHCVRFNPKGQ